MPETIRPVYNIDLDDARKYDRHVRRSPMYQGMVNELTRWANVKAGEKVLCLAGGTGLDARALIKAGATKSTVFGFDLSFPMVEEAVHPMLYPTQGEGLRFIQADAKKIPFPSGQFDTVVINAAGEYLWPNLEQVFSEISRVLKPEGKLVFNCQADELGYTYEHDPQRMLRQKVEEQVRRGGREIDSYTERKKYGMTAKTLAFIGEKTGLKLNMFNDVGIETSLLDAQRQLSLEQFNKAWMRNVPKEMRSGIIKRAARSLGREGGFDRERHWVFFEFSKLKSVSK